MSIEVVSTTVKPKEVVAVEKTAAQPDGEKVAETQSASEPAKTQDETIEESETSEEQSQSESQDDDNENNGEEKNASAEEKAQKSKGADKKIKKLVRKLSEKDQAILDRDREIEHWKKEALKGKPQEQADAKKEIESDTQDLAGKPVAPKADDFQTYDEFKKAEEAYVDKLTDWKIDQRELAKEKKAKETDVKTQYQKQIETHQERVNNYKKEQSDYEEVLTDFIEEHGDIKFSRGVEEAILSSDLGPAVIYELAKNKGELDRINSLGVVQAAKEIGKIEARLSGSKKEQKQETKLTKAPPPIAPIGSKGSVSNKNPAKMNYDEYKAWRQANP